jgi:serralysin
MFQETFAGGSGESPTLADNTAPGGARATVSKSVIHNGGCGCLACHGNSADKSSLFLPEASPSSTIPGGITTTATISPGGSVASLIDTAGDSDWFRISLVAGQSYTFTVTLPPSGLRDSILTLRDANGVSIRSNDDVNVDENLLYSEIRFTATTTGTFFLDVTAFGSGTGNYILSSSRPVADAALDSASTTASLTVGGAAANASLEQTGDRDWYRVTLEAGETYEFITSSTGGAGDVDTTLTLRDASGNVLAFNDDSSGTYSRIRFVAETSGTFFLDVGGYADSEAGTYRVSAAEAAPLAEFTIDQIADQLTNGFWGGPGTFRRFDVDQGESITVNLTQLTAEGIFLAREALGLWADVLGVTFTETTGAAQISFDDNQEGAFASSVTIGNVIRDSAINVGTGWLAQFGTGLNSYSFSTYVHEIGHALGLGHAGNYNGDANYAQDASYLNDSWATTVMSYFDQIQNSFFAAQGFTRAFALSPQQADIVAIQQLYGDANSTRTGDTIYGVGNTSGRAIFGVDSSVRTASGVLQAITIVDNGGIDTLDYSTFSASQLINLNAETFSNVGGSVGNLSIARGTVIENAVGGTGADTLTGNGAANRLTGGLGNDTLNGGANVDTAVVRGNRSSYTVTQTSTGVFQVVGADGTDTLTGVEFLQFNDQTLRLRPGTGVSVNFETNNPSVYQSALNNIRDFDGNALGGNGSWLRIGSADVNGDGDIDQIIVNRAIGRFATVGTAPDGLVYFSDHGWAGETRVAGIYIDPFVANGTVAPGSPNDSQRRFQNDLQIENINRVLGANDYDRDGGQEVFFALTDGTAYLRAVMHADGNIRFADYLSQQQVIDYLTANGFGPETYAGWFTAPSSGAAAFDTAQDSATTRAALAVEGADITALPGAAGGELAFNPLGFAHSPIMNEYLVPEYY